MSMPGFTGEASLYKTRLHYRTGQDRNGPTTRLAGPIHLAVIDVPGEVIEIVEDAPWDPLGTWVGGHTGPGTPVPTDGGHDGGGGGGASGSGGTRPPGQHRPPMRIETLGKGPKYSQIRDSFTCKNAGGAAEICYSCSDTAAGQQCTCYYCVPNTDECTQPYFDGCPPT
jgi:hypothetical protein